MAGKKTSAKSRLSLSEQREKLVKAIAVFHKDAQEHLSDEVLGAAFTLEKDMTYYGEDWDNPEEIAEEPVITTEETLEPEKQAIALPSTLGLELLKRKNLWHLVSKERMLREGQMNDCLQRIRAGIAYRSYLYRGKVRKAASYRAKLRSFDDVHVADEAVHRYVRIYGAAREAALRLFDMAKPDDILARDRFMKRYRTIVRSDLKANTAIMEAFTPGLRNEHQSWLWNFEDDENAQSNTWLVGRKFCQRSTVNRNQLIDPAVRRMLWLRAYARKERWDEERKLVKLEMESTVRYFGHQAHQWEGRAHHTEGGCRAYALRQVGIWITLREDAENRFNRVLGSMDPDDYVKTVRKSGEGESTSSAP